MSAKDKTQSAPPAEQTQERTCGLIMPISSLDGVPVEHWLEVRSILTDAVETIESPKFAVRLVSDADETGIIQKRIVQNVYGSDIIVCDVSGKNPNVMFELGMRLAFDKAVVIVKDDKTDYSFDTGIIEHLTYPRDLRFSRIIEFKNALRAKVLATYKSTTMPDHSPFLKNFGRFHVATLSQTEVSPEKLTLELMEEMRREIARISRRMDNQIPPFTVEIKAREGRARLRDYVAEYLLNKPELGAADLADDEAFHMGALLAADPAEYFAHDMRQFRAALERAVKGVGFTMSSTERR